MKRWEIAVSVVLFVIVAAGLAVLVSLCIMAEEYEAATLVFIAFQLQFLIGYTVRKDWL